MLLEIPQNWRDYELIDSGNFEKLERFGNYILWRPEPKALWNKSLSDREWEKLAHTHFITGAGFGKSGKEDSGTWKMLKRMPEQWYIKYNQPQPAFKGLDFKLRLGLTSFKHVGVFPEQAPNWNFIYSQTKDLVSKMNTVPKVINLFAYTGAASLAAKTAGADTTHLDSVRQVVTWAKGNMECSGLNNIRWVVEDALKFVKREAKRGNLYNGIILDPPAYGHGPDGEKWKLDELLYELLCNVGKILAPKDAFMVLNLYSNGYSALLGDTAVRAALGLTGKGSTASLFANDGIQTEEREFLSGSGVKTSLSYGELVLCDSFGKAIPLSVYSRLRR